MNTGSLRESICAIVSIIFLWEFPCRNLFVVVEGLGKMFSRGNSFSVSNLRDGSWLSRQQSRGGAAPQPQVTTPEPKQNPKATDARKKQSSISSIDDRSQAVRQPSSVTQLPRPQPLMRKTEANDQEVAGTNNEEFSAPPEPNVSRLFSTQLKNDNKAAKAITVRDGSADEATNINSGLNEKAFQKEAKDDVFDLACRLAELNAQRKASMGEEKTARDESGVTVITLSGENRGATMDLGSEKRNDDGMVDIYRGYKLYQDDKNEVSLEAKPKPKGNARPKGATMSTYVNSNVQGANNSILYNSSCPNRDPGVRLDISNGRVQSSKPIKEGPVQKGSKKPILAPQAVTANPPVKRRCLRALFLESSPESSPERSRHKPPKPIRHGCRYECQGHGKCKGNFGESSSKDASEIISSGPQSEIRDGNAGQGENKRPSK